MDKKMNRYGKDKRDNESNRADRILLEKEKN